MPRSFGKIMETIFALIALRFRHFYKTQFHCTAFVGLRYPVDFGMNDGSFSSLCIECALIKAANPSRVLAVNSS